MHGTRGRTGLWEKTTDLREIALFADLPEDALHALRGHLTPRRFAPGEVVLAAGEPASELHVIVDGAVQIDLDARPGRTARRPLAGPGQTIGEMSILTGAPVSATVMAHRSTTTLALSAAALTTVLANEPALYRAIARLLANRLRHRTHGALLRPAIGLLEFHTPFNASRAIRVALLRGIQHYAPGSTLLESGDVTAMRSAVSEWRERATGGQYLILATCSEKAARLLEILDAGDVALRIVDASWRGTAEPWGTAMADMQSVRIGAAAGSVFPDWTYALEAEEALRASEGEWRRERYPAIDRIVRYITGREIGIALSVGAAAGLAHLGFLEVLERADIPIDYLCGSSMGGAVALGYGAFGNVRKASEAVCRVGAAFAKVKGIQLLPRAGLVSQGRMQEIVGELFGSRTFADLCRPVAVVAADLVAGERVVLERGSVAEAARATAAIPGIFPPVLMDNRILVDGGLVTRVPADLLSRRRCGLKLAAVARSRLADTTPARLAEADRLRRRLAQPLGFRTALAASWKLLGWWDSATQAQKADVVVNIDTPARDDFNFAAGPTMIECGRAATEARLEEIRAAVQGLLAPGMP